MVIDRLGRPMRDLRLSVTDRCNFRCTYCMPREVFGRDFVYLAREDLLSFEEMVELVRVFVDRGVTKIRLTGGEPLLRRGVEKLVGMLRAVPGVEELTMTSNGSLLAAKAEMLAAAGLDRVTVSLDALDDATFRRMSDSRFPVAVVLEAIDAASAAGLGPVKVNCVVQRGVNQHAVPDLAEHFRGTGHIVRFIEYMDVGTSNGWRLDQVVSAEEIVAAIDARHPLEPIPPNYPGEVATRFRYRDGSGEIGVIASVTRPFCGDCTRARLSADGVLYTCLFASSGVSLRDVLRGGGDVGSVLDGVWSRREDRYSELRSTQTVGISRKVEMSYIGG